MDFLETPEMKYTLIAAAATIIGGVLSAIIGKIHKRKESDDKKRYDALKREVAEALTLYSCYYSNPIDIAKTDDNNLPENYAEGSNTLRLLGSKLMALAETARKEKELPITRAQMKEAAGCLIGLSNSFATPYNCDCSAGELRNRKVLEKNIRNILSLDILEEE